MQFSSFDIFNAFSQATIVVKDSLEIIFENKAFQQQTNYSAFLQDRALKLKLVELIKSKNLPGEIALPNYPALQKRLIITYNQLDNQTSVDTSLYVITFRVEDLTKSINDIFRHTIENASDLMLLHNLTGETIFISRAFERVLGYEVDEVRGKKIPDFVHPDYKDQVKELIKTCILTLPTELSLEFKAMHKDNTEMWLKTTVRTTYNNDNEPIGFQSELKDITYSKAQQELILQSRAQYQYLFDNNPNPLLIVDLLNGQLLKVNQAATNMYGYSGEELLKKYYYQLRPKEEAENFTKRLHESKTSEYYQYLEVKHQRKNGEIFYVNAYGHKLEYDEKDCDLVLLVDISYKVKADQEIKDYLEAEQRVSEELRASEEELRRTLDAYQRINTQLQESETKFRTLAEHAPIGIYLTDKQGNCIWVNKKLHAIFDFKDSESFVKQWLNRIHPEDYKASINLWLENAKLQTVSEQEYRIIIKGKIKYVKTIYSPIYNTTNEITGYVGSLEDLTQRKEIQKQQLYHSQFRELLLETFSNFVNINFDELDGNINLVLEKIANFANFDYIHVNTFNENLTKATVIHQYNVPGKPQFLEKDLVFDTINYQWWMQQLYQNKSIEVTNVDDLPLDAKNERQLIKDSGATSMFVVPMFFQEKLFGHVSFFSTEHSELLSKDSKNILRLLAQILSNLFHRASISQKLRESESLYRLLADNISDLVTLHDTGLYYQYISPTVTSMIGYTVEELKGRTSLDFVHPEDVPFIYEKLQDTLKNNEVRVTYRFLHKDGRYIWIESSGKLIDNPDTNQEQLLIVSHDVSNRVEVTKALSSSQVMLSTIFDESTDAILIVGDNQTIQDCNQRTLDLFEASVKEDLVGKREHQFEIIVEQIPFEEVNHFAQKASTDAITNRQVKYKTLKGNFFWANFASKRLQIEGIYKTLVTLTDITPIRKANARIEDLLKNAHQLNDQLTKQNEELLQANQELDNFVYSVSHDLRAPLTSAMGLIEISRDEKDLNTIMYYLDLQEKSLKKLDNFIHDIVNYSRNSRLAIEPDLIDFKELIQESFDQLRFMESSASIEQIIEIEPDINFHSDKGRLGIIFGNLISNTIRYSDTLKPKPFTKVSVQKTNDGVKISVTDNGQGIGDTHQEKIFDMFYRATDNKPGSGLGLYILKEALKKIKGRVEVESVIGEGTTFTLFLPNLVSDSDTNVALS